MAALVVTSCKPALCLALGKKTRYKLVTMDFVRYRTAPLGYVTDIRGRTIELFGVSHHDSSQFFDELSYLQHAIDSADATKSFDQLLSERPDVRTCVQQLLKLNGLSDRMFSLRHIQELLWCRVAEDADGVPELRPGLLIEINMPRTAEETMSELKAQLGEDEEERQAAYERVLAILSEHTGGLTEAIEVTHRLRTDQILSLLEQKAELAKAATGAKSAPKLSKSKMADLVAQLDASMGVLPDNEQAKAVEA